MSTTSKSDEQFLKFIAQQKIIAAMKQQSKNDPQCPKCGRKLSNKMIVVCQEQFCPINLN